MKQIADGDGDPDVWQLERDEDGLWLYINLGYPVYERNPDYEVVFRLRKLKNLKT